MKRAAYYASLAAQAVASKAGSGYDKAKPVVEKAAAEIKDVPTKVLTNPQIAVDFIEGGAMPGPPSPATYAKALGYGAVKGAERIREHSELFGITGDSKRHAGEPYVPYQNQVARKRK